MGRGSLTPDCGERNVVKTPHSGFNIDLTKMSRVISQARFELRKREGKRSASFINAYGMTADGTENAAGTQRIRSEQHTWTAG